MTDSHAYYLIVTAYFDQYQIETIYKDEYGYKSLLSITGIGVVLYPNSSQNWLLNRDLWQHEIKLNGYRQRLTVLALYRCI